MEGLINQILNCSVCMPHLQFGPRPIFSVDPKSKIVIIGQAPGSVVHKTGIPWDDMSGNNLRKWMDISNEDFYDPHKVALIPMGFCYPGKGKSGDLPPRKECAPLWHDVILSELKEVKLVLLIGKYSQDYYLKDRARKTLTDTVKSFKDYLPEYFVLPHPSPRNNIWQAKNEWFKELVLPDLRTRISDILI